MAEESTVYETEVPEVLRELLEAEHGRLVRDGRLVAAVRLCFRAGWEQGFGDGLDQTEETAGDDVCPDCAAKLEVAEDEAEKVVN